MVASVDRQVKLFPEFLTALSAAIFISAMEYGLTNENFVTKAKQLSTGVSKFADGLRAMMQETSLQTRQKSISLLGLAKLSLQSIRLGFLVRFV